MWPVLIVSTDGMKDLHSNRVSVPVPAKQGTPANVPLAYRRDRGVEGDVSGSGPLCSICISEALVNQLTVWNTADAVSSPPSA